MRLDAPRAPSRAEGVCGVLAVVVVAALAVATLLRPAAGYTTAQPLLLALALGAGLGAVSLLITGLLARAVRAGREAHGSLWGTATGWPIIAIVVGAFVIAAAAPHVVDGIVRLTRDQGASRAAEQSDFRDWQQVVVPIVLSYTSALQKDAAFSHGFPRRRLRRLLGVLMGSQTKLEDLRRRLQSHTHGLRSRPELARLTASLDRSLALAQRAQRTLSEAVIDALRRFGTTATGRATVKGLAALGVSQLHSSQAAAYAFSLEANKLGASLFVPAP